MSATSAPIAAARCLDALHYVPWHPSPPPVMPSSVEPAVADNALARFARVALRIRHTMPGRVLYNLAPKALVNALKERLP